ncbi:MAG: 3-deoxy-7-phosphoheptulonate synthase [Proteobacteria bacterium]|nr:3-deoxy-7-phosphoheptulonate synthase [Cystobacterineae bacterium]MCL2258820.1 3-deoxy-7-phosphoheptulonate synthase [Cystobacterineae bacterium]MCL2314797.1 3-deoxy-7-phosphoheptulonate synthase [Pseudomonadota bacterium]
MVTKGIDNVNVAAFDPMPTPQQMHALLPLGDEAAHTVRSGRRQLEDILARKDKRLFVIVGPCSIHDTVAGLDYARRLFALSQKVKDSMLLVMRVYFEKPRTSVGWKGFVNDPYLDDSFRVAEGMQRARQFLLEVARLGLPAAAEALDPVSPQYLGDLIGWTAIGARTTESQTHREMASGLSTPVGFKNGIDGNIGSMVNALLSAMRPHSFLGINAQGLSSIIRTKGNPYCHIVLRGAENGPNYSATHIAQVEAALRKAQLPCNLVVDCSHANSQKNHHKQPEVFANCLEQLAQGNKSIVGFMLESFIEEGNQPIPKDLSKLRYGLSVTDACIGWECTESMLLDAHAQLQKQRGP